MQSTNRTRRVGKNYRGFFVKLDTQSVSLRYIATDMLIADNLMPNESFEIITNTGTDTYSRDTIISYRHNVETNDNIVYVSQDTTTYIKRVLNLQGSTFKSSAKELPPPLAIVKPIQTLNEEYLISPSKYFILNEEV